MTNPTRKIAVVTGAGTGIGRAAALALMNDGWAVVLAGRRPEPLQEVASHAKDAQQALVVPTDVADPVAVKALFDAAVALFDELVAEVAAADCDAAAAVALLPAAVALPDADVALD